MTLFGKANSNVLHMTVVFDISVSFTDDVCDTRPFYHERAGIVVITNQYAIFAENVVYAMTMCGGNLEEA